MNKLPGYLLIESRDPFEYADAPRFVELARALSNGGERVTLFLVQNGVLPARQCAHSHLFRAAARAGVEVLADDFSLRERGIQAAELIAEVKSAPLDVVIDRLVAGCKAMWH